MDLRAKLGRLRSANAFHAIEAVVPVEAFEPPRPPRELYRDQLELPKTERIAKLRALIGEVAARDRKREPVALREAPVSRELPWTQVSTAHGVLHVLERWLEPDHHHGRAAVRDGLRARPGTLATLTRDPSLLDLDLNHALYLDTETTGLAGGTGTVAFLIGLARFVDGVLCVEQLIVPELGHEGPALARLAERIAAASCIVTYNGKSFDWPLLRTRFVLGRQRVPPLAAHVDLLHVARAVWKQRMPSVRLADVEREILSFEREHDIPGSEIPARYFEYLRDGSAERLAPVLEHNQNDLIALAALLGVLITRFERVEDACDARDAVAFGRIALRARDSERALSCARAALASSAACESAHALLFASDVQRQLGDIVQAAALLEQALQHTLERPQRAAIHFALTKLYEHEQGELAAALRHARHTEPVEGPTLHGRRLGRLHRRLLRPVIALRKPNTRGDS